jgi:hypothetical protein
MLASALVFTIYPTRAASAQAVNVSNSSLEIGIDPANGSVMQFQDLRIGHNFAGGLKRMPLWEIDFLKETNQAVITANHAKSFECQRLKRIRGSPQALTLTWAGFELTTAPALRVHVNVELEPGQPTSLWTIAIEGLGDITPTRVRFPRLSNIPPQERERLAVPLWLGQQTADARKMLLGDGKGRRAEWVYPGLLSLQCLAFYAEGGPGLYVACDDSAAFRKSFAFFGDGQGNVGCDLVHLPMNAGGIEERWTLPYRVVLGTFTGDWITAAERYRTWGTNQAWAKESRLQRGAVPEWISKTGMWVWNRGRSPGVLSPALALQQRLGLPVSVFWHWWHGCCYDTGFPEYLPPREGIEPFESALTTAHAEGVHTLVYMNQRLWGTTTRSWTNEAAEKFAVKDSEGKIHPEIYNTFTKEPCVSMCLGTPFWRHKYAGLAERAVNELGVDGIYMDQACSSLVCFDTSHGHPAGGGTYWVEGFRSLANEIRGGCEGGLGNETESKNNRTSSHAPQSAVAGPSVALAGEGCGEAWLPYLDLMLCLQVSKERYAAPDGWETIPFFQAVYHPYAITYGNYSSLTMPPYDDLWPAEFAPHEPLKLLDRKFSRQFFLEQARAFVWGQQPTIANFLPAQFEQRLEETEYMTRLARIRSGAGKYLLWGTFLRAPDPHAPEATLDMSRLSIYAGQQGGLTAFRKECPLAIAGAWRATDGDVALAVASIAEEPLALSFEMPAKYYRLPKRGKVYRTDEAGRKEIGNIPGATGPVRLALPPRGACLLEFAAH